MTEDERAYLVEEREDQRKDDKLIYDFERQEREIKRLRSELESKSRIIKTWDYMFGEYGPTDIDEKITNLRAEIERKDEIIREVIDAWDNIDIDIFQAVTITDQRLPQALSTEEVQ